jgi:iron-sulfur cluster assembly protein
MGSMATGAHETTLVSLTERAAAKIKQLMAEEPDGEAAVLRVAIQGGGCSGFQYALGFDRGAQEGDHEFESPASASSSTRSARRTCRARDRLPRGIQESGFKIDNPNAVASCGCGHSFQVEEGEAPDAAAAAAPAALRNALRF